MTQVIFNLEIGSHPGNPKNTSRLSPSTIGQSEILTETDKPYSIVTTLWYQSRRLTIDITLKSNGGSFQYTIIKRLAGWTKKWKENFCFNV